MFMPSIDAFDILGHGPNVTFKLNPIPNVKFVSFNHKKKITYVKFSDGSDVQVKCKDGEEFNEYHGFCAAITKRFVGGNAAVNRVLADAVEIGKPKAEG